MQLKLILPTIAVIVVALGVTFNAVPEQNTIETESIIRRETITDFSHFPMSTLPSEKILEKTISDQSLRGASGVQNTEFIQNLGNGYD